MKIIYRPDDSDQQEFIFRPGELTNAEAEMIEDVGGGAWDTWEEFSRKFMLGGVRALRAGLWVCLRKQNPRLRFVDVSFRIDQVECDLEDDEAQRLRDSIDTNEDLTGEEREQVLEILDQGGITQASKQLGDLDRVIAEPVGKEPLADSPTDST